MRCSKLAVLHMTRQGEQSNCFCGHSKRLQHKTYIFFVIISLKLRIIVSFKSSNLVIIVYQQTENKARTHQICGFPIDHNWVAHALWFPKSLPLFPDPLEILLDCKKTPNKRESSTPSPAPRKFCSQFLVKQISNLSLQYTFYNCTL